MRHGSRRRRYPPGRSHIHSRTVRYLVLRTAPVFLLQSVDVIAGPGLPRAQSWTRRQVGGADFRPGLHAHHVWAGEGIAVVGVLKAHVLRTDLAPWGIEEYSRATTVDLHTKCRWVEGSVPGD